VDYALDTTMAATPPPPTQEQHHDSPPVEHRFLLGLTSIIAALPFSLRSSLGWCLGYLIGLLPLRERTFTRLQLKVFLPEVSTTRITPRVFANAGQTLLESLNVTPILARRPERIECACWDKVQGWLADSRPIVALTAHTGNWDLLAAWVIAQGVPLTTIGREARKQSAQAILRSIRDGYGIETIWRSDRSGLKRLISCLKERRVLAALIDQDTRVESISVPFFGAPAKTPVSLITLGRKMNARFVTAFIFRTGWLRYSIFLEEIPDSQSDNDVLAVYNKRLETLIRRFPEQWVWFHKRWRSPSGQEALSSRAYEQMLRQRLD
jgi:KDO2-lipid IV(A) lauroyltransferase